MACPCSKKVAPEGMDDIVRDRKCTDLLWLLFFVLFWCGMLVIGVLGLQNGDPRKLVYGKNYNSQVCVSPSKYVYYPRINEDMYGIVMSGGQIDYDKIPFYGIGAEPVSKKTESKKEAPAKSESVDEDEEAVYL